MKKTKAIAMIVVFIMLVSTILNCVAIGSVNAEETVNIKKVVTSTNGTVEYEISGLEIEEGHEYQWGIVKTKGDTINDDKWNDVLAPNFNTKTIKATVDSTKYLDILKVSDDAYISVKEKGKTTNILDEAKVDLSLPLGKSYSVEKSEWYNRNVPSNPAFSIDSVYGISPSEIQYGWEEITDASIINSYIDNNHDISGLNLKGKDDIPSSSNSIWKNISVALGGRGEILNSQLPANDGLYYVWLKNSSTNIKTVYGQVIVEIGEVKKVTNNTDGQNTDNQNTEGVKLDPNNLISYPMFIFGSDGTITIDNSQTGYELYYQCVEIDDATYQKITDKNTTREKAIGLIPKYNDNNWKKTTDNKFTIDTSTYTGKKAFAVWSKLKSSDGTISYDVEVYSVSGTKKDEVSQNDESKKVDEKVDGKDETTATTKIPQTGQSFVITGIIAGIFLIGLAGYKFIRKNRDIK